MATPSIPYALLIVALLASPSVIARAIYEITGDPLWQWLAIDEQRLASSDTSFETDSPYVQIRVYWGGPDRMFDNPQDAVAALKRSFAAKGIDSFVALMPRPQQDEESGTMVDIRAGTNRYGPFPIWDTARHVQPAVLAARMSFRIEATREHSW